MPLLVWAVIEVVHSSNEYYGSQIPHGVRSGILGKITNLNTTHPNWCGDQTDLDYGPPGGWQCTRSPLQRSLTLASSRSGQTELPVQIISAVIKSYEKGRDQQVFYEYHCRCSMVRTSIRIRVPYSRCGCNAPGLFKRFHGLQLSRIMQMLKAWPWIFEYSQLSASWPPSIIGCYLPS